MLINKIEMKYKIFIKKNKKFNILKRYKKWQKKEYLK